MILQDVVYSNISLWLVIWTWCFCQESYSFQVRTTFKISTNMSMKLFLRLLNIFPLDVKPVVLLPTRWGGVTILSSSSQWHFLRKAFPDPQYPFIFSLFPCLFSSWNLAFLNNNLDCFISLCFCLFVSLTSL